MGHVFSEAGPMILWDSSRLAHPASTLQVRKADSKDIAPADIFLFTISLDWVSGDRVYYAWGVPQVGQEAVNKYGLLHFV
jgi:hypothetical protein